MWSWAISIDTATAVATRLWRSLGSKRIYRRSWSTSHSRITLSGCGLLMSSRMEDLGTCRMAWVRYIIEERAVLMLGTPFKNCGEVCDHCGKPIEQFQHVVYTMNRT